VTHLSYLGADFARGWAYLISGILRLIFVTNHTDTVILTSRQCMLQMYHGPMVFGQQGSSSMVMLLAVDRFLAVFVHKRYRHFGRSYALKIVFGLYLFCFLNAVLMWFDVFWLNTEMQTTTKICKQEKVASLLYFKEYSFLRFAPCTLTPLFYLYTMFYLKFGRATSMREQDKKKQYKLTKNILIIILNDFLFMAIPFGYSFYSAITESSTSSAYDTVNGFSISLSLFGAAGNMILYSMKYPKFRVKLLQMLNIRLRSNVVMTISATIA